MFAQVINGIIIQLIAAGSEFTYEDVTYPSNWIQLATPEEKAQLGIVDVVYGTALNDQYYWVSADAPVYNEQTNQVDINFTCTAKDLPGVQSTATSQVNSQAYSTLLPSDWMVVQQIENGTQVPAEWNAWRQSVRNTTKTAVDAIAAATNVDQVALAVDNCKFLPDPNAPTQE